MALTKVEKEVHAMVEPALDAARIIVESLFETARERHEAFMQPWAIPKLALAMRACVRSIDPEHLLIFEEDDLEFLEGLEEGEGTASLWTEELAEALKQCRAAMEGTDVLAEAIQELRIKRKPSVEAEEKPAKKSRQRSAGSKAAEASGEDGETDKEHCVAWISTQLAAGVTEFKNNEATRDNVPEASRFVWGAAFKELCEQGTLRQEGIRRQARYIVSGQKGKPAPKEATLTAVS